MTRILCSVSALALLAAPVAAQEIMDLDEITVFSGFENVSSLETGVAVEVIDATELASTGETRLVDFLARQPSVTIRSRGPMGSFVGLSLRGIGQNNISVRIDGIDVSDPSGPQVAYDFGGLMTSDISRIEILRGAQSAAFGSEAMGGTINITTKRAEKEGMSLDAAFEYGSFNTSKAAITLGQRGAGYDSAITISRISSDGFSAADGGSEEDGYDASRVSVAGSWDIGGVATLHFSGFAEDSEYDYDEASGGVISDGTPDEVTIKEQRGARVALSFGTGVVDHEVFLSGYKIYRNLSGTNGFGPFDLNFEGKRAEFGYQGGLDVGSSGRLVFGATRTREDYESWNVWGSASYDTTINSVYTEYSVAPSDALDLSLAIRHDDHSQFGGFWTGRLSGVYRLSDDVILRANAATGYRAPSSYELYDTFSGDATLQPETSKSFDFGVEKQFSNNGYLRATAFWAEAEDIIDYSYTTFTFVQRSGTATRKGIELAGGFDLGPNLTLDGAYTLTDSETKTTLDSSSWSTSVPRHSLSVTLGADLSDRAHLTVTGLYEADRAGLDDYGVVNTALTYDVTDKVEGYVRIENLFDADYQTVPGYATAERSFYVGLRASF